MNAKELRQLNSRYVRIILDGDSERYINANFDALLEYIGSRFPLEGRTSIGSAYVRIRKETDRLLQVSWRENWSLKTSKREIKSIRQSSYWLPEKRGQHYYIMIPYKIGFIFTAIVNIVSEISQKESYMMESIDGISILNRKVIQQSFRMYSMLLRLFSTDLFGDYKENLYVCVF